MLIRGYGLDAAVLSPPFSVLTTIALFFGISCIGYLFLVLLLKRKLLAINDNYVILFISPILGSAIIGSIIYPLLLFGEYAYTWLYYFAKILSLLGIITVALTLYKWNKNRYTIFSCLRNQFAKQESLYRTLLNFILIGMGLMALAPPTDADELNYHIGVPLAILHSGSWIFSPEWFSSRLAGMGEGLIALGLSVGAEQFGSLLQYWGLVAISAMLVSINRNKNKEVTSYLYPLIFSCSPVLLWLVSTSKPLLLPIAYTTLSLFLIASAEIKEKNNSRFFLTHFSIAIFLISCATQMKFNFLLSAALIGTIWLIVMYRAQCFSRVLFICPIISLPILLPPILWKFINYGGSWYEGLFKIFPGNYWPGYEQFENALRHWHESSSIPFPFNLLITSSPGQLTTIIGIGSLFWVLSIIWIFFKIRRLDYISLLIASASVAMIVLGPIFGQIDGRFYLEPLIWILILLAIQNQPPKFICNNFLLLGLSLQAMTVIGGAFFCAYFLAPGALSKNWRDETLNQMAYQHKEMEWVNQNLPQKAVVLSAIRAMAGIPRESISLEWSNFIDPIKTEAAPYIEQIIRKRVSHVIMNIDPRNSVWVNCLGENTIGPYIVNYAGRNPLNRKGVYEVWISEFNLSKLPNCLNINTQSEID